SAGSQGCAGSGTLETRAVCRCAARVRPAQAVDCRQGLGTPGSYQSINAEDFSLMEGKADGLEVWSASQIPYLEQGDGRGPIPLEEFLVDRRSHHLLDQLFPIDIGDVSRRD